MTEYADRHGKVAGAFTQRVRAVPADGWEAPAPCEGWVARDVVRHLTEWVPGFLSSYWDLTLPPSPSVDDDPVGAWLALDGALRSTLDDPALAASERDSPIGRSSLEATLDQIVTGDVLIHTWDLARATGLDERLDPDEVRGLLDGIEPMDEALRSSGHYGPKVAVPDDAGEQDRLLAFLGRQP
jgi:uncharacterized protein (TIGR03086 family)